MAEFDAQTQLPPAESAGARLRLAREAAGLGLGDVAARTKIAERHLASIEQSRFDALASRTYAVGFARAYARAVGLDEAAIAQAVRDELAAADTVRQPMPVDAFEPGDPARVPGSRLAWLAALFAIAVLGFVFLNWRSFFSPAVSLPDLTAPEAPASAAVAPRVPAPPPGGPVVFTALEPGIWVKFTDAAGNQLLQKELAQGESYAVPTDAVGPVIRTARPDALQVTVGGRIVPKLSDRSETVSEVPVSAAALLARTAPPSLTGASSQAPSPAPQSVSAPASAPTPRQTVAPAGRPSAAAAPTPRAPAARPAPSPSATAAAPTAPATATAAAPAPTPQETSTVSN